jgi:hypothetical protein
MLDAPSAPMLSRASVATWVLKLFPGYPRYNEGVTYMIPNRNSTETCDFANGDRFWE